LSLRERTERTMAQLTLTVSGSDLVIDMIEKALSDSQKVLIQPSSIFPGWLADIESYTRPEPGSAS
jgi:hypothetical protein